MQVVKWGRYFALHLGGDDFQLLATPSELYMDATLCDIPRPPNWLPFLTPLKTIIQYYNVDFRDAFTAIQLLESIIYIYEDYWLGSGFVLFLSERKRTSRSPRRWSSSMVTS